MLYYILYVCSAMWLFGYIAVSIKRYGIPVSLSETAYLYGSYGPTAFLAGLSVALFPLLIVWLHVSEGLWYQVYAFLSAAGLLFVSVTGRFKGKAQNKVHFISAGLCAAMAQSYVLLSFPRYWLPVGSMFLLACILGRYTRGKKSVLRNGEPLSDVYTLGSPLVFWLEMTCFTSTYVVILIQLLNI